MTWWSIFFKSLPKTRFFAGICFPHRNDMPCSSARRPDHDHHASTEMADRENAQFAVVSAIVGKVQRITAEKLSRIFKIKPALRKRDSTLDRIVSDLHLIIVATNKKLSRRRFEFTRYSAACALTSADTCRMARASCSAGCAPETAYFCANTNVGTPEMPLSAASLACAEINSTSSSVG